MNIFRIGVMGMVAWLVVACGGGGGGDPQPSSDSGSLYTGATYQARITPDNAAELTLDVYQNGSIGGAVAARLDGDGRAAGRPRILSLAAALERRVAQVAASAMAGGTAALQTEKDTIAGGCGGEMSYEVSYDDGNGDFRGSISFSGFCEDDVTLSGRITFDGRLNVDTGEFVEYSMDVEGLSAAACGDSYGADGRISASIQGASVLLTIDFFITDGATGKVYWLDGFRVTVSEGMGYNDLSMKGRFYHPDHGYVDVATVAGGDLRVYDGAYWPASGRLVAEGANGTRARLEALDGGSYRLEVDADGIDGYEQSEVRSWSEWDGCDAVT